MFGITAYKRACQGDHLPTGSDKSPSRMPLSCIGPLLLMDFIQAKILEVVPQPTLNVQGRFVTTEFTRHLPERTSATWYESICLPFLGILIGFAAGQHPFAPGSPFPQTGPRLTILGRRAGHYGFTLVIDQSPTALRTSQEPIGQMLGSMKGWPPLGPQLGPIPSDDVPPDASRLFRPLQRQQVLPILNLDHFGTGNRLLDFTLPLVDQLAGTEDQAR